MSSSGVISKKLKFKGDKPKKKKRSHRESRGDDDGLEAMAAADPSSWMFPTDAMEVIGPSFIILPTQPLSCLAYDPNRKRVYAAPIDVPEAPEGANELTDKEVLQFVEPSDVNHVWVVSRLAGSDDVISLRTTNGTFLSAAPSGVLSADAPSRGPLEGFRPTVSGEGAFPLTALKTCSDKYVSINETDENVILSKKAELRADAESIGLSEGLRIKCQREHVLKARIAAIEGKEGGAGKRRLLERGPEVGSMEDELRRNRTAQAWGGGRHHISSSDRRELKKASREGRIAEAMLDRRAAMKSDRYAK